MNALKWREKLQTFLFEDVGDEDITSQAIFSLDQLGSGHFVAKEHGIVAGIAIIQMAYQLLDASIIVKPLVHDGEQVNKGDIIAKVRGPVAHLLTGERVVLNLIQRMSGIATVTKTCVELLNDEQIRICDTRKTAPGLRMFDKHAVVVGGGANHRRGLYDAVMIKDNHIAFSGSITRAVQSVRRKIGHMVKIEVETESKEQVLEAVAAGADVVMFDNRSPDEVRTLTTYVPAHIRTEASGGITLANLHTYAHTGVDYISLGFITNSVQVMDISFYVDRINKQ